MRRTPIYRTLRRTAASATLAILFITLASICFSVFVWSSDERFAGIQFGRFGWGKHTVKHGEVHLFFDARRPDFDWWFSRSTTFAGFSMAGSFNRWVPLWVVLAPAAGLWLLLVIARRRFKPGCCTQCGYDLSGTPRDGPAIRCPECGAITTPVEAATLPERAGQTGGAG